MSLVTIFALFGDDLRNWLTSKQADVYFDSCLVISMIVFTLEILINTIVVDEFKYSFFFWLDIIATMSLIMDIDWILDFFKIFIAGATPSYLSMTADPLLIKQNNSSSASTLTTIFKSLRLIRLIRIIKIYKYIVQ